MDLLYLYRDDVFLLIVVWCLSLGSVSHRTGGCERGLEVSKFMFACCDFCNSRLVDYVGDKSGS